MSLHIDLHIPTYKWRAPHGTIRTQDSNQAWDGVAGGIIINGATTANANYDEDKGSLFLTYLVIGVI